MARSRALMAVEWLIDTVQAITLEGDAGARFNVEQAKGPSAGRRVAERMVRIEPARTTTANEMRASGPATRPIDVRTDLGLVVFYPSAGTDAVALARRISDASRLYVDLFTQAVLDDAGSAVRVSAEPQGGGPTYGSRLDQANQPVPTIELTIRLRHTEEAG